MPSSLGTLLKLLHTFESISFVSGGAPCQRDSWRLAAAKAVAIYLFSPEFVLKAFTEKVINHLKLHMIAEVFQIFFFQSGLKSREPGKNHIILFALNWNSESTILCSHFPKVIANWCELLNSLHLIAAQGAQDDLTLNSSLIFAMYTSPWLFLVMSWLRLFPQWCTCPPCTIAPSDSGTWRSDAAVAAAMNHAGCLCFCPPWMFSLSAALYLHCRLHTDAIKHNKCIRVLFFQYDTSGLYLQMTLLASFMSR